MWAPSGSARVKAEAPSILWYRKTASDLGYQVIPIKQYRELGPEKILVNTVGPGRIDTERVAHLDQLWAEQAGISYTDQRHQAETSIPLGAYGEPADFARIVVFLCSEANAYLTGQNLLIDGGLVGAY